MTRTLLALLCLVSLLAAASAGAKTPPPKDVDLYDEAAEAWFEARLGNAKKGQREIVRVPLVQRSMGWGCSCPDMYIGDNVDNGGGGPWVEVEHGRHADLPGEAGRFGWMRVVEGYFTGETTTFDPYPDMDDAEVEPYTLHGFHVLRSRVMRTDNDKDTRIKVVLDGEEAKKQVAELKDAKPWLAIARSIPLGRKKAAETAEATKKKLVEAGYEGAQVLDSRAAPRLFCCFTLVLVGRYGTKAEALAAAKAVKKNRKLRLKPHVRKGW